MYYRVALPYGLLVIEGGSYTLMSIECFNTVVASVRTYAREILENLIGCVQGRGGLIDGARIGKLRIFLIGPSVELYQMSKCST